MKCMYLDILNYDKFVEILGDFKVLMGCCLFLLSWKDVEGYFENNGCCNFGVVIFNLFRMVLEFVGNMMKFWEIFYECIDVLYDVLFYCINCLKDVVLNNVLILYKSGVFNYKLKEIDDVVELFKNKCVMILMGYIGLYEIVIVFYGLDWEIF